MKREGCESMRESIVKRVACGVFAVLFALTMSVAPGQVAVAYAQALATQSALSPQGITFDIEQTIATSSAVTFSWEVPAGTAKQTITYTASVGGTTTKSASNVELDASTSSYTLSGLEADTKVNITIYAYKSEDATTFSYYAYSNDVKTLPSKVSGLSYYRTFDQAYFSENKLSVAFSTATFSSADGYQCVLYTKAGKKVQTVKTDGKNGYVKFSKATLKKCYKVRIRPYMTLGGTSTTVYGSWSSYFYAVPAAKMKDLSTSAVKKAKAKVSWTKVSGASKYQIYVATSKKYVSNASSLTYKKVATVSSLKSSYTIKKAGGKKLNTKKYYYYIRVVTVCKYGSKTAKSQGTYSLYCHQ